MKKVVAILSVLMLCACGKQSTLTSEQVSNVIKDVPNITEVCIVTEENDVNGQLNKQGGYTGALYFRYSLISDEDVIFDDDYDKDACEIGTIGGGSIEIYGNSKDLNKREDYLSSFDGGILSSFHKPYDNMIIRISENLTATQQNELYDKIVELLKKA